MQHVHPTIASRARRLAAPVAFTFVLACGSTAPDTTSPDLRPSPSDGGSLAGTSWVLARIDGAPPRGEADITLVVDDASAGGFAGCNLYGGAPAVTEGTFRLDDLVSTLMACEDARLMDQESEILGILGKDSAWDVEDGGLVLRAGAVTLLFRAADAGP